MRNEILIKTMTAEAAVESNRIVKHGAADTGAIQATAASSKMFGVSNQYGAAASGDDLDVVVSGIAEVELGGTVAAGDLLTSDAVGKAIATTTAGNRIVGVAMTGGVNGDIQSVLINPGSV